MRLLLFRRSVFNELGEIRSYIRAHDPQAARDIVLRILDRIDMLAEHPFLGRPGRVPNTRGLVITGTPFIVPYWLPNTGEIEILAVLHGARRWPDDFSR